MISVRKKDGGMEEWSNDKLVTSIGKSGVDIKTAEEIANRVASWSNKSSQDTISSTEIRDKVISELKTVDEVASEAYRLYKK